MSFSLLLFFSVFLGIFSKGIDSTTPSVSKYIGSTNFQFLDYSYANLEFKFEEDLHVKDLVECQNKSTLPTCSPCNYSSPVNKNKECINATTNLFSDDENDIEPCECNIAYCGGEFIPKYIVAGVPFRDSNIGFVRDPLRYNHIPRDQGFEVSLKILNGTSDVSFSVGITPNSQNIIGYSLSGQQSVIICPSDPRFANTLTFFIIPFCPQLGVTYDFEVIVNVINTTFSPPPSISEVNFITTTERVCISSDYDIQNSSFSFEERTEICEELLLVFPLVESSCRTISILAERTQLGLIYALQSALIPRSMLDEIFNETISFEIQNDYSSPLYFQSGDNVFSLCPNSPSNPSDTVFIIRLSTFFRGTISLFIRDVTDKPEVRSRPIGTLTPLSFQGYLFDSIGLSCPCYSTDSCSNPVPAWPGWDKLADPAMLTNETSPDFARYFSLNGDQISFRCFSSTLSSDRSGHSCKVVRVIPVLDSPLNPLIYPMPEIASDLKIFPFFSAYMAETGLIVNDTIGFLIQLSSIFDTTSTILDRERYELCSIRFVTLNRLHGSITGEPPSSKPFMINEIKEMSTECQGSEFSEVVDSVGTLFSDLTNSAGNVLLRSVYLYSISALVATRPYWNCYSRVFPFYEFSILEVNNSQICFDYDPNDPCCNTTLAWTDCCIPDGRIQETTLLPAFVNQTHVESNCDDECAEDVLLYLRDLAIEIGVQRPCDRVNEVESLSIVAKECSDRWFGDSELGYPCDSDLVCQQHFGQGECDISVGRCINVRDVMEERFLFCLFWESNSLVRTVITSTFNFSEAIVEFLYKGNQIVSDYGPMSDCAPYITGVHSNQFSSCPSCDKFRCPFLSTCDAPFQCVDRTPTCVIAFEEKSPRCSLEGSCIWNVNATEEECGVGESMCMYCYNSTHCKANHSFDQTECGSIFVCVLPDDVIFNITQEECENRVIAGTNGYCDDVDFIYETLLAINDTYLSENEPLLQSLSGACIFPLNPNNSPTCPYLRTGNYSLDFSTRRGCVVFADCLFNLIQNLPFDCSHILQNESECVNEGGRWLSLPIPNQEQCEDTEQLYCSDTGFYVYQIPRPFGERDGEKFCEDCHFMRTKPSVWINGTSSGIYNYTKPQWKKAEMVTPYHSNVTSIDHRTIDSLVTLVDNTIQSFSYSSSARCYYAVPMEPVSYIVDSCISDDGITPNNTEGMFLGIFNPDNDPFEPVSFGEAYCCPGMSFRIFLLNGYLDFITEPDTFLFCGQSEVFMTWRSQFVGNRTIEPLSLFGDPNLLDPDPVRNDVGASVGIVVSDGFFFENQLIPEGSYYRVEVSVDPRLGDYDSRYTIYDFGSMVSEEERYRRNELEVRPMNIKNIVLSTNAIGQRTASATIFQNLVSDETTSRTFLILRLPDFSEEGVDELLSDGEKVMLYVFCGLYGLSFLFVFGVLVIITLLTFSFPNFLMMGLGSGMMCLRSIYVGVYAAGYLQGNSIGAILMVETPSFLYLALGGLIVIIFTYTHKKMSSDDKTLDKRPYWIKYVVFIGMLVVVFVIIAVLMVELPEESNTQYSCFGWNVEEDPNKTVENIRIAYHSLALFLASICAGRLFFLSKLLHTQVVQSKKVMAFAWGIGLGVLCQNIMWVVYSAVRDPTPYVIIPMFILEAIPVIFVAFLVVPKENFRRLYMIRKTTSSSFMVEHS